MSATTQEGSERGGREARRGVEDQLELIGDEGEREPDLGEREEPEPDEQMQTGAGEEQKGRGEGAHHRSRLCEFDALHPPRRRSLVGSRLRERERRQRQSSQSPETSRWCSVATKPCRAEIRSSHGSSSQSPSSTTRWQLEQTRW